MIGSDFWLSVRGKLFEFTPMPGTKEKHARELAFYDGVIDVYSDLLAPYRYINEMSLEETTRMLQQVLEVINAAAQSYLGYDDDGSSPTINSCYMTPILRQDFTDDVLALTKFVDHDHDLRTELRAVLQLVQWAKRADHLPTVLYLPVPDRAVQVRQQLLFGAPWAFEHNIPQFIDDTLRQTRRRRPLKWWVDHGPAAPGRFFLPQDLSQPIVDELTSYFVLHQHHMRSFVSIPLPIPPEDRDLFPPEYAQQPLAVLNIQSNKHRLLGRGGARARTLLATLVPVLNVLIRYISRVRLGVKL